MRIIKRIQISFLLTALFLVTLVVPPIYLLHRYDIKEKVFSHLSFILHSRSREILSFVQMKKEFTNQLSSHHMIQKMFKITRDTANRDLRFLLENDLLIRRGKGKATYYELA